MSQTTKILGLRIFTGSLEAALDEILLLSEKQTSQQIYFITAVRLLKARLSKKYARIYKNGALLLPVGRGMRWAAKKYGTQLEHMFSPVDLFMDLLRRIIDNKQSVFFLGSKAAAMSKAVDNFRKNFPLLRILGSHAGFFDKQRSEQIVQAINKFSPKYLFVGMGFPKQECWIENNKKTLPDLVTIPVGNAFDLSAGISRRGPAWMKKKGLEGLYKLKTNPLRLFRFFKLILFWFIVELNSFKVRRNRKKYK